MNNEFLVAEGSREETSPDDNEGHDFLNEPDIEEEEEEDECRVCRGPAEEGRPLFSPCKCSGSIGLTHQDCLTSWLAVTRGEGRCELCKVKFKFAPLYAENTPDRLSVMEVLLGLGRRALARWLPFILRLALCLWLWLCVVPLLSAYIYILWTKRSISAVSHRWAWKFFPGDTISGAVLAASILISFLCLMSFADFLRVEWQQQQRLDPVGPDENRRLRRERLDEAEENRRRLDEVDNAFVEILNQDRAARVPELGLHNNNDTDTIQDEARDLQGGTGLPTEERDAGPRDADNVVMDAIGAQRANNNNAENVDHNLNGGVYHDVPVEIDNQNNAIIDDQNVPVAAEIRANAAIAENPNQAEPLPRQNENIEAEANPRPEIREAANADGGNGDLDPLLQDEQVDMEINVALDELLGLRGPISGLVRNMSWLLLFNTLFLGFFTFVPGTIGATVFSNILNTTAMEKATSKIPLLILSGNETFASIKTIVSAINKESEDADTIFRLPDFAAVNFGYAFCAGLVVFVRLCWILMRKFRRARHGDNNEGQPRRAVRPVNPAMARPRAGFGAGIADAGGDGQVDALGAVDGDAPPLIGDLEHNGVALGEAFGIVLDATVSIVKVGILLFLKMFLLPVLLGIWLDGASMGIFGSEAEDRILYAGRDLFSFILLHWVAGITFMLLVTVSVLQLREVAHPDLLAHLIRPQEPQPDLLGNLMHDSLVTQTKRMLLSLGIYTALLHLHVALPAKIIMVSGIGNYMPFLKLKFWHILMPQLQVPLELLIFHLSMLALLEKYKNSIGEMQHHWLVFICSKLSLTEYILPREIKKFRLIGHFPVTAENGEVNRSLYDLAERSTPYQETILSQLVRVESQIHSVEEKGETRENGERVITSSQTYISLPAPHLSPSNDDSSPNILKGMVLLPTALGPYRLKRRDDKTKEPAVEVWEEVPGEPVPRPPEGWDDLGVGGADIQGRWAWGKEKKSAIERGVAQRSTFLEKSPCPSPKVLLLMVRVLLLLFFSWCATTFLLMFTVAAPLGVGRLFYLVLRIPEKFVHNPLSFAIGSVVVFPAIAVWHSMLPQRNHSMVNILWRWAASFRMPPARKAGVLCATAFCWLVISPFALGFVYELFLLASPGFFSGEQPLFNSTEVALSWLVGAVLLNLWAFLCCCGFFTRDFWVNIGNGMLEVEGENRRNLQVNGNENDAELGVLRWQGKDGRLTKFFGSVKNALLRWEWETVDRVVLLEECAFPVSRNIGILLLAPAICYFLWFWLMKSLVGLDEISGNYRLFIFRLATVSTLFVQLSIGFRRQIQVWFSAVHKTARDDRYLIGEVLLDYK